MTTHHSQNRFGKWKHKNTSKNTLKVDIIINESMIVTVPYLHAIGEFQFWFRSTAYWIGSTFLSALQWSLFQNKSIHNWQTQKRFWTEILRQQIHLAVSLNIFDSSMSSNRVLSVPLPPNFKTPVASNSSVHSCSLFLAMCDKSPEINQFHYN